MNRWTDPGDVDLWTEPIATVPTGVESADVVGLLALAVALLVVTLAAARTIESALRRRERFACPFAERAVQVEFRVWRGRRVGVLSCTAFTRPQAVTCARGCLERRAA